MWIGYMRTALKGSPEKALPRPDGLVALQAEGSPREEFVYRENVAAQPAHLPAVPVNLPPAAEAPDEIAPFAGPSALPGSVAPAPVVERSPTPVKR
jgi:penicillin-binding protein 1A